MSLRRRPSFEQLEDRCVPATVTNTNPSGAGSLQQAILDTPAGGTVNFQPGLGTIAQNSFLVISKNLTIDGGAGVTITSNSSVLFLIDDANSGSILNVNLTGLRLTGTSNGGNGGAIFNAEVLTVTACTITASNAQNGGGIFNNGTLNLVNSTVAGNTAQRGAGLANNGTLTITSSTVSGNIGGVDGGGLYNASNKFATIVGSTFSGNTAASNGGGLYADLGATTTISNSTFSGNSAANAAGGISSGLNASLTLTNCTLTGNRADSDGNAAAGLLGGGVNVGTPSTALFNNTIVAGNVKGTGAGTPDDITGAANGSNNLIGDANSSGGLANGINNNKVGNNGVGTIAINTVLSTALAPNGGRTMTHALVAASPALDAGSNNLANGLTNDQRGAPFNRIANITVDIGASERQTVSGLSLVATNAIDENDGDYTPGDLSLREAIGLANGSVGANSISVSLTGTHVLTLGELRITDDVTVNGPGAGVLGVSGNNLTRVLNIDDGTSASINVTIKGLRLSGGNNASGLGGGIFNAENLTFTQGTLSANSASEGGGLYNAGSLSLSNSTIAGNTGSFRGGGMVNAGTGNVSFTTLSLNSAGSAGGGGISNTGPLTLTSSTLSQNSSGDLGGGIQNFSALTVINSTFSANTAVGSGGGIANAFAGTATITNSTLTANRGSSGGGINANTSLGAVTRLFNSIVAGNLNGAGTSSTDIIGSLDAASRNNLIGDAATAGGLTNGVNFNIVGVNGSGVRAIATILNPTLASNGGLTQTHALVQNSLAIAAASNAVTNFSAYDQRDAFRDPTAPDIGAYEVQHPLSPVGTPSSYARTFLPKPSGDANTAFVKGLYQSALLRDPDSAGLATWVANLEAGQPKHEVAYGFINSVENRTNQVTFYYRYFLSREPDAAGLAGWVSDLQRGVDEGKVMEGFLLSPEFTAQTDNAGFVNLMYYALLGRQADPAGFADWKNQLDTGTSTRADVGRGFLRSDESLKRVVTSYFGSYLKRTIDSAAATPYVNQLQSGVTFGRIAANILGSGEFFFFAGQNLV